MGGRRNRNRGNVVIEEPCVIGANTRIKKDSVIGSYSVLGDNNIIGERSGIRGAFFGKTTCLKQYPTERYRSLQQGQYQRRGFCF